MCMCISVCVCVCVSKSHTARRPVQDSSAGVIFYMSVTLNYLFCYLSTERQTDMETKNLVVSPSSDNIFNFICKEKTVILIYSFCYQTLKK